MLYYKRNIKHFFLIDIQFYNIAFVNYECWLAKSRVDITLCQHRKFPATLLLKFFVLYYKRNIKHFFLIDIQFYNIAFVNSERWLAKSRVDITLCQHRKFPATLLLKFFVLYYKRNIKHFFLIDIQFYNIAFVNSERWLAKSRVDITLCQHRKFPATLLLKFFVLCYKRNIKHFFRIDIQIYQKYQHSWKLEKLEIETPPRGHRVSTQFLIFPISTRVDITVYQHWKCFIFLKCKLSLPSLRTSNSAF